MDHKLLEAKASVTTDLGEFEAIAAAYSVDRVKERIVPGAFKATIAAWRGSGKQIPLHWDHSGNPEDIIGTIDPASIEETEQGLLVKGKLDLDDSEVAREAWRSMKANRVGLSFGYLVEEDALAEDGIRELKKLDLFEITITPAPANPDTRFLDLKSVAKEVEETIEPVKDMGEEIVAMRKRLDEMEAQIADVSDEAEKKLEQAEAAARADRFIALRALAAEKNLDDADKAESQDKATEPEEVEDRDEDRKASRRQDPQPHPISAEILAARLSALR